MKQVLHRQLRRLYLSSLAAIAILVFLYVSLRAVWGEHVLGNFSLLTLIVLCILLIQSSGYWWLKLRQLEKLSPLPNPRLISYGYAINLLLLLLYPVSLVIALLNDTIADWAQDALIGGILYIAALSSFVHYFLVKLVRSNTDRIALTRRRQVTARFMRELQRSELRKKTL